MILTGPAISQEMASGRIRISPFDPRQLNEASYDLRLGRRVVTYDLNDGPLDPACPKTLRSRTQEVLDGGFRLVPGVGYLLHTEERVCSTHHVAFLDGKSTCARMFLMVHFTAGYIDPGFDGQYTLEAMVVHPLIVYPGQRIAQVRFHEVTGDVVSYQQKGFYTGENAVGAVPSAAERLLK